MSLRAVGPLPLVRPYRCSRRVNLKRHSSTALPKVWEQQGDYGTNVRGILDRPFMEWLVCRPDLTRRIHLTNADDCDESFYNIPVGHP